jgi:hypothetical protein
MPTFSTAPFVPRTSFATRTPFQNDFPVQIRDDSVGDQVELAERVDQSDHNPQHTLTLQQHQHGFDQRD